MGEAWTFLLWLWSLIPHPTAWPGPDVAAALSVVLGYVGGPLEAINWYSPINLFFLLVIICLAEEGILATWHAIRWLISHIPQVGGDV